jgi:hypothetical protein
MASYIELRDLHSNDELRNRITTSLIIGCNNLLDGTPTAVDRAFIEEVVKSPDLWGKRIMLLVLAENSLLTVAQITGATDAQIQTAVNSKIPQLVLAFSGS